MVTRLGKAALIASDFFSLCDKFESSSSSTFQKAVKLASVVVSVAKIIDAIPNDLKGAAIFVKIAGACADVKAFVEHRV